MPITVAGSTTEVNGGHFARVASARLVQVRPAGGLRRRVLVNRIFFSTRYLLTIEFTEAIHDKSAISITVSGTSGTWSRVDDGNDRQVVFRNSSYPAVARFTGNSVTITVTASSSARSAHDTPLFLDTWGGTRTPTFAHTWANGATTVFPLEETDAYTLSGDPPAMGMALSVPRLSGVGVPAITSVTVVTDGYDLALSGDMPNVSPSLELRNVPWAKSAAVTLPWDGTERVDNGPLHDWFVPGDAGVPSGAWVGDGETPATIAATASSGASRTSPGDASDAAGAATTLAAGRTLRINGLYRDEWETYRATDATSILTTGPACHWRSGRNRLGRHTGGWRMHKFGNTSVQFHPDGLYDFHGATFHKGTAADQNPLSGTATGAFSSRNPDSDLDVTFLNVGPAPHDYGEAATRVRLGVISHGEGRRADLSFVGIVPIIQLLPFGPTSLSIHGGRGGSGTPGEGVQVSQPAKFVTYESFEAGLGPDGVIFFAGSDLRGMEFINPKFGLDKLTWRSGLQGLARSFRQRFSPGIFAVGVFTDLAVRLLRPPSIDAAGILAYTHTTFRRVETSPDASLGDTLPWHDESTTTYGTLSGDTSTIRVPVFYWDVNGGTNDPPTTTAQRSRTTQTLRVRRADIVFVERSQAIDTTIGPNDTAVDIRMDPSFTGTIAQAGLLDYDGAARRFTVTSTEVNGTTVHTIAVHRNSTMQQLYNWLKWEYSRGALDADGPVPARAHRHLEALPVEVSGTSMTIDRDWVLVLDAAQLSPSPGLDQLNLSSQHDYLGAPEWDATAFYTPDDLVKVTAGNTVRWWVCTNNAGPGQTPGRAATGDPALVRWREVTDLGTVVFRSGGSLAAGLRYIDAHGRSVQINTEPGASVAHTRTVQRTRLVAASESVRGGAITLRHLSLDGTRHPEEDITIPGSFRTEPNHLGGLAYLREHNDWAIGRGHVLPGRGSQPLPIIYRYDAVGHRLAGNLIPGLISVNGISYFDAEGIAIVGQSTSGTPQVRIIPIADISPDSAPRGISGGRAVAINGLTQPVSAGIAWGGGRLWVAMNEHTNVRGVNNLRISVVAVEVTETGLAVDWSRSFKVANEHSTSGYSQWTDGVAYVDGTIYVHTYGNSLQQAIAYTPPDGTSGPANAAALQAAVVRTPSSASTFRLNVGGDEVYGLASEVRDVATGTVTTGTAGPDGSYSFTVPAGETRPVALVAKKYGFDMRGVMVQPTDTAHALSLPANLVVPRAGTVDLSDYLLTEATAAARPAKNVYLELNDPATSRQSVLRFADTYDIRSDPDKFKAILDTVLSSTTGAEFFLRFFLNSSSHNGGRVVEIAGQFIDILEPYLRFARKAGLSASARAWAGIATYTGDGTSEYEAPVENGGRVNIPPPRTLVTPSFANMEEIVRQVFGDRDILDGLNTNIVQPTADAVAASEYFETPFRLRAVRSLGYSETASEVLSMLAGESGTISVGAGALVRLVVELLDDTGAGTTIPQRHLPGIQGTVGATAPSNWSFRVWTAGEGAVPNPSVRPSGDPIMSLTGAGGTVARTPVRGDVKYAVMEIENPGTAAVGVTVTGFRISSRLAFSPTSVHVSNVVDETKDIVRTATATANASNVVSTPGTATAHAGTAEAPKLLTARALSTESRGALLASYPEVAARATARLGIRIRTFLGAEARETLRDIPAPGTTAALSAWSGELHPTRDFDRVMVELYCEGTNLEHSVAVRFTFRYNARELSDDYTDLRVDSKVSEAGGGDSADDIVTELLGVAGSELRDDSMHARDTLGGLLGSLLRFDGQRRFSIRLDPNVEMGILSDIRHGILGRATSLYTETVSGGGDTLGKSLADIATGGVELTATGRRDLLRQSPEASTGVTSGDNPDTTLGRLLADAAAKAKRLKFKDSGTEASDIDADVQNLPMSYPATLSDAERTSIQMKMEGSGSSLAAIKAETDRLEFSEMGTGRSPVNAALHDMHPAVTANIGDVTVSNDSENAIADKVLSRAAPSTVADTSISKRAEAIKEETDKLRFTNNRVDAELASDARVGLPTEVETRLANIESDAAGARKGVLNTAIRSGADSTLRVKDDDGSDLAVYDLLDPDGSPARTGAAYTRRRRAPVG